VNIYQGISIVGKLAGSSQESVADIFHRRGRLSSVWNRLAECEYPPQRIYVQNGTDLMIEWVPDLDNRSNDLDYHAFYRDLTQYFESHVKYMGISFSDVFLMRSIFDRDQALEEEIW